MMTSAVGARSDEARLPERPAPSAGVATSAGPGMARSDPRPGHVRPGAAVGRSLLVLDDEPGVRSFLQRGLARHAALVEAATTIDQARELLRRCHFDLIIADIRLSGASSIDWVEELHAQCNPVEVIFITAYADLGTAIAALRAGAADFIIKPFRIEQLLAAVERCFASRALARENYLLQRENDQRHGLDGIVGRCDPMKEICSLINRVAGMPSTILIQGESGTGKELAARAIHARSGRPGNFVAINCGAVSPDLLEGELFGHVKGAFTGAHQAREGLFSFAHGGTLFLDEIGEMPPAMQAKLLRVLEEKAVRPVGGNQESPVDVRIIAATNRDLAGEVSQGRFREDLFYRLNVISIGLPPLRDRPEDIPGLAEYFLDRLSAELGVPRPPLEAWDVQQFLAYNWPGNVRELRNVIERCLLLGRRPGHCLAAAAVTNPPPEPAGSPDRSLAAAERRHILAVLRDCDGNKSAAARLLGITRKTLGHKLKAWGLATGGDEDDDEDGYPGPSATLMAQGRYD